MPEFILDRGNAESAAVFASLDEFTQGYIEAAFWLSVGDGDGKIGDADFSELASEALADMREVCADFQQANAADLALAYATEDYSERTAGVDLWLTRNRHGAGFWDRGLGDVGKRLSDMATPYGSCDLYRGDDDKVYL